MAKWPLIDRRLNGTSKETAGSSNCLVIAKIILALAGTLFSGNVFGVQPPQEEGNGNCVFRIGLFDGSSAEFSHNQPDGEHDI